MDKGNLSEHALGFLATLQRRPYVLISEAIARFEKHGIELPDSSKEFHIKYAGYVIPLGLDEAILGIAHNNARFHNSNGIDYELENGNVFVACADAHPSFDFWLSPSGELAGMGNGGPHASFDEYIEKLAVIYFDWANSNNA